MDMITFHLMNTLQPWGSFYNHAHKHLQKDLHFKLLKILDTTALKTKLWSRSTEKQNNFTENDTLLITNRYHSTS